MAHSDKQDCATMVLDRLFDHERIDGHCRVARYLDRWVLARLGESSWYLHRFTGSDWSTDLHDHPKSFLSIGLVGRMREHQPDDRVIELRAPWIRRFPATHLHRLELAPGSRCWTICRVGQLERDWGFETRAGYIGWEEYVFSDLPERLGSVRVWDEERAR